MLSLYTGTPGSYKSYSATADVLRCLKLGYNVICNFYVDYEKVGIKLKDNKFVFIKNSDVTVQYFLDFARENHHKGYKCQTCVFLDEAGAIFNSRLFQDKNRMEWINFFANHRHFNYDFVLITQVDMMIDKQIRALVETEYRHRALKNYKIFGFLINLIFHGCYMRIENWYPCRLKVGSSFKIFRQKIANCYDTMALFIDDKNNKNNNAVADQTVKQKKEVEFNEKSVTTSENEKKSVGRIKFKKSVDVHNCSDTFDSVDVVDSGNSTSDESVSG